MGKLFSWTFFWGNFLCLGFLLWNFINILFCGTFPGKFFLGCFFLKKPSFEEFFFWKFNREFFMFLGEYLFYFELFHGNLYLVVFEIFILWDFFSKNFFSVFFREIQFNFLKKLISGEIVFMKIFWGVFFCGSLLWNFFTIFIFSETFSQWNFFRRHLLLGKLF